MGRKKEARAGGLRVSGMQMIDLQIMKRLLQFMADAQLTELDIDMEGVKVRLRKGGASAPAAPAPIVAAPVVHVPAAPVPAPAPAPAPVPAAPPPAPAPAAVQGEAPPAHTGPVIKSPMVGTFYRAPSPTAPPFVSAGDVIKEGQTLCIIEAMKLMNEIKAEQAGKIKRILVENGQPVEFDQVIFELEAA